MWDALWINARIATMQGGEYNAIDGGAIGVTGGKIAWIGPTSMLPGAPAVLARTVHDTQRAWITPGLIDCHTHIVFGGNRAREFEMRLHGATYEELSRAGGGIMSTVRATRDASPESLLQEAVRRAQRLVAEGVTVIEVKSGYGLNIDAELKCLRVARALAASAGITVRTTFLGAHALPLEFAGNSDAYIDYVVDAMLPAVAAEKLADGVDAFCETIGFTPAQTRRLFERARRLGLPVKLHADQLSDLGGAALAAEFGALSADHLEYTSLAGVAAMARAGTVAVLLPGAFYFLRERQAPPVAALRDHGVPMAISTDCNPGSSPATSILLMMNMACTLFRLTPEEALAGATIHAAKALGMDATHGSLEVGKIADLVLWQVESPAELAYGIGANPCIRVVRGVS